MADIEEIRNILTEVGTDIPEFIKTGIPENIKSQNIRSIHTRSNDAEQQMLDLIELLLEGNNLLQGEDDPNVNMPSDFFAPGYFFLRWKTTEFSRMPIEFYIYTGVPEMGWFRLTATQFPWKYFGAIENPNTEPIPTLDPAEFRIGDYYIQTSDATPEGNVQSIWLYSKLHSGDQWVRLAPSPSTGSGFMTLSTPNEVTADWIVRMTNLLNSISINFLENKKLVITGIESSNSGWRMIFSDSNIELESYEDTGSGYDWVPKGAYLRTLNGESSTNGNFIVNESKVLTSKNFSDLGVDENEPLTGLFDEIISRLVSLGSAVQTGIKTPVGLSCAGNPNYPASEEGDSYKVTAAGRIGGSSGIAVEIGDMIVCTADSPGGTQATAGANFFVLQTNVDQATESIPGFAKIATNAQATAGTDDTTIVTPKKLGFVLSGLAAQNEANSALTQNYSFFGLTAADKQKDYNEAIADEAITEVTIIPLTAWNEAIEATTDYSGLSYVPYPTRILSIKAVSETAPVRQSIKISVSKNDTFIGKTNAFLEIPTTGRISTGTHDIVGTDLITGDRLRFYCNQTGDGGSTGVQIILITKKISDAV